MSNAEKIMELKKDLENVKGTPCDVYSRVVGFHTPVRQWNEGKKEEFCKRETFSVSK
jgi:anaerobic ribonucleoside-triphosphate reductase